MGNMRRSIPIAVVALTATIAGAAIGADEFERPPIEYSSAEPDNDVSQLQERLERGELQLRYEAGLGYLRALLEALEIPAESQMLVFSKTSLQRSRIAPRTPRAIYFNDDLYVGYCQGGETLEISAADPKLGTVFYTLDQQEAKAPALVRQTDSCLQCHAGGPIDGIPSHLVRSVFVDSAGQPLLAEGSHRVDHTTPVEDRWGGWYVTGTHGSQTHLGNAVIEDREAARPFTNERGQNVTDLSERLSVGHYLTPHSDIVALMVLEHQTMVHNYLTKANFVARQALHYQAELNRALGEPEANPLASTASRIQHAGDDLLEAILFVDEAPLVAPMEGTSAFAQRFAEAGPRDSQGRSLRDFDLATRMFKYPCSYLIYAPSFDNLPDAMKSYVAKRLRAVLTGEDQDGTFSHLTVDDLQAILEILSETKPGLWSN